MITTIVKRDGRIADFNIDKIANAIFMAAKANGGSDYAEAEAIAAQVVDYIENKEHIETPHVEHVQDVVEKILIQPQATCSIIKKWSFPVWFCAAPAVEQNCCRKCSVAAVCHLSFAFPLPQCHTRDKFCWLRERFPSEWSTPV